MAVDVEVCLVAMQTFTHVIRHPADRQNVTAAVESKSVVGLQTLASKNLGVNQERGADRQSEMDGL